MRGILAVAIMNHDSPLFQDSESVEDLSVTGNIHDKCKYTNLLHKTFYITRSYIAILYYIHYTIHQKWFNS
jgi:hypothetical protein